MRCLVILALGVALGIGGYWYFTQGRRDPRVLDVERRVGDSVENVGDSIKQQVSRIDLDAIRDELARTGRVIRQKALQTVAAFNDDGTDARITAALRTKFTADPLFATRVITVATRHGQVTLTGDVASHEEIARAMQLAFEVDGVREVVAELQLRRTR